MARPDPRLRLWCFTRNQRDDEAALPDPWTELPQGATWLFFQRESASREHYQGVVYFKNPVNRDAAVVKLGAGGIHLIACNGTAEQNKTYCSKTKTSVGEPVELGIMPSQGKRNDVHNAVAAVRKRGYEQAFEDFPDTMIKYPNGMKEYSRISAKRLRGESYQPPEILVLIGPTECGKTRLAREIPSRGIYMKNLDNDWWDGYSRQQTVILDDFYGQIKYSYLLRLLDGNPVCVNIKGSHAPLLNRRWIITSNTFPWEWYSFEGSKEALYNRLWHRFDSAVYDFTSKSFISAPGTAIGLGAGGAPVPSVPGRVVVAPDHNSSSWTLEPHPLTTFLDPHEL